MIAGAKLAVAAAAGLFAPTLRSVAENVRRTHYVRNRVLREHRPPTFQRAMRWMRRHPVVSVLGVIAGYVVVAGVTWFEPFPGPTAPQSVGDYYRDFHAINMALLGAQATFVGLVFPLVIAFVSLINQGLASFGSRLRIYFDETEAVFVGASALALCAIVVVQLPLSAVAPVRVVAAGTIVNCVWLVANIFALGFFLVRTIEFVHPATRARLVRNYAANSCWRRELTALLMVNRWHGAVDYGLLPRSEKGSKRSVGFTPFLSLGGRALVTRHFASVSTLSDVRLGLLRALSRAWLARKGAGEEALLTIAVSPGSGYRGEIVLARSNAEAGWLTKALLWGSFQFERQRRSAKEERASETAELLKELIADLLVLMEQGRAEEFEIQLEAVGELHAFLFEAAQPRGEAINYAQLQAAETRDLAQVWMSEFRDLQRRATAALDRDTEFFAQCGYIGPRLFFAVRDSVKPAALTTPLIISHNLFHHLVSWSANKHRITSGKTASAGDAFELPAGALETYDSAWRSFIAPWEFYLTGFFEHTEGRRDWAALTARSARLFDHLRRTSEMVGRAAWAGDKAATRWSCDMLLKWESIAERGWKDGEDAWSLRGEALTADVLSEDWANVAAMPLSHFDRALAPETVFGAVVSNALRDHIVAVSSIMLHWGLKFGQGGAAIQGARMLLRDAPYDEGSADFRDLGPVTDEVGLISLVRIMGARTHYAKGYSAGFDDLAESLGRLSEAPYVSMRIYSSSGGLGFSGLYLEHALILMAGVRDVGGAARLSDELRRILLEGDDEARRRRIEYLESLHAAVGKVDADVHGGFVGAIGDGSQALQFVERQSRVRELVELAVELLKNARLEGIRSAPIDPDRLRAAARAAAATGFAKDAGEFPLPLFSEVSLTTQTLESWTLNVRNRERGEYTCPLMAASSGDSWLSSAVAPTVGSRVLSDVLHRMTFEVVDADSAEGFWRAIKDGAAEIRTRGGDPMLIVSGTFEPRWLHDWRWRNDKAPPDDLRVHQEDVDEDGYQFSLNEIRVYQGPIARGAAYLVPRAAFARVLFHDYGEGCAVKASFENQADDPWHGTLRLEYQREVTVGQTEALKIVLAPRASAEEEE